MFHYRLRSSFNGQRYLCTSHPRNYRFYIFSLTKSHYMYEIFFIPEIIQTRMFFYHHNLNFYYNWTISVSLIGIFWSICYNSLHYCEKMKWRRVYHFIILCRHSPPFVSPGCRVFISLNIDFRSFIHRSALKSSVVKVGVSHDFSFCSIREGDSSDVYNVYIWLKIDFVW